MRGYVPEKVADSDLTETGAEGAIRESIKHDTGFPRRPRTEADASAGHGTESQNALILRVAAASTEKIDRLIFELQDVRDKLCREGERINGDLARYVTLNQHLVAGMKIIAENLARWEGSPKSREQAIADFKLRLLGLP